MRRREAAFRAMDAVIGELGSPKTRTLRDGDTRVLGRQ